MQTLSKPKRKSGPNPLKVSPRNIAQYKSGKLSYAIRDLTRLGVSPNAAAKVLMARGVVRNFLIRQRLLRLNCELKSWLQFAYKLLESGTVTQPNTKRVPSNVREYYKHLGKVEAMKSFRKTLNILLTGTEFECPENDPEFANLLRVSSQSLINS